MRRLFALSICLVIATLGFAQKAIDGHAAKLSTGQIAKLHKLKQPCYLPAYIPAGFVVTNFAADAKDEEGPSFDITYSKAHTKQSLTVQMASGGIGDIFFDEENGAVEKPTISQEVAIPGLGKCDFEAYDKGKNHQFHTQWIDLGEKHKMRFLAVIGFGISGAEGIRIAKSLRLLK